MAKALRHVDVSEPLEDQLAALAEADEFFKQLLEPEQKNA
jgi:hypothetical protein